MAMWAVVILASIRPSAVVRRKTFIQIFSSELPEQNYTTLSKFNETKFSR